MASIELIQNTLDWRDNGTSAVLPAGKWSVSGNEIILAGGSVAPTVYDYPEDRLQTVTWEPASVFWNTDPRAEFMQKTDGHLAIEVRVTSCNVDLTDAGVFVLVEASSYSGSWSPDAVALDATWFAKKGVPCDTSFTGAAYAFVGLGFVPWHLASNTPLANFLSTTIIWDLAIKVYWTDTFLVVPPFWQNFSVQLFGSGRLLYSQREV